MRSPLRALFALVLSFACLPALAGRLADLPWDDRMPQEIRSGIRTALWKERDELQKQKNEKGKHFVRVYDNSAVEILPDGKVLNYLTIQRCLADRMVTERWKYTFEKQGRDYAIVARDKVAEMDDARPTTHEGKEAARPLRSFRFVHDLLELTIDEGAYALGYWGDTPESMYIGGTGHLRVKPLDEREAMFFERRLKRKDIDSKVTAVEISFFPGSRRFLDLAGHAPGAAGGGAAGGGGAASRDLEDLLNDVARRSQGQEFTPFVYAMPGAAEYADDFRLRINTADHGWITYSFSEHGIFQIDLAQERAGLSIRSDDAGESRGFSFYNGPEVRQQAVMRQERRAGLDWYGGLRYDAQFDIDNDTFTVISDAEVTILRNTRELWFFLAGNPTIRYVKVNGDETMVVPIPNRFSKTYGFEETTNAFNVRLPREFQKGEIVSISVSYESPKLVRKIDEGFWWIERGGFLPFGPNLSGMPGYMRFVIRTKDRYTHLSIGSKLSEEVAGGFRISEWAAESGINFPTMLIGKYHTPMEREASGVRVVGYQTSTKSETELTNKHLEPHLEEAVESMVLYEKLLGSPYPFRDLKIVGTPAQAFYSQSPTSIVYVGQVWMLPEAMVAEYFKTDARRLRGSTAHELAHQWFGGQITNVGAEYWWVESFSELLSGIYRRQIGDRAGWQSKLLDWHEGGRQADGEAPIQQFYRAEKDAQSLYYNKGPAVLWMLTEYFSEQDLFRYVRAINLVHAGDLLSTSDLEALAERVFRQKMDWFFDQYIRNMGTPEVSYRFEPARPAEDGTGWIIRGKLQQRILVKGEEQPGKAFRNLLVPMTVDTDAGVKKIKDVTMDGPEKDVLIRLESKPKGSPRVNPEGTCYMTVKAMCGGGRPRSSRAGARLPRAPGRRDATPGAHGARPSHRTGPLTRPSRPGRGAV